MLLFDLLFIVTVIIALASLYSALKEGARQKRRQKEFNSNPDKLHREYAALKANKQVDNITIGDGYLTARTKTLFCRNPKTGVKHEIGRFEIRILLWGSSDDIRWFNLDRMLKYSYWTFNAPHVNEYGECELSVNNRILKTIDKTLDSGEYAAALETAIAYVETAAGVGSIFDEFGDDGHISNWPVASEQ